MSTQCILCFPDDGTAKEDTTPLDGMPREDHRDKDEVLEARAGTGANQGIYRSGSINNPGEKSAVGTRYNVQLSNKKSCVSP